MKVDSNDPAIGICVSEANDPHDIDSNCLRVLLCIGLTFNLNLLLLLCYYFIIFYQNAANGFASPHDRNIRHKNSKYSLALHSGRRGRRRTPCCRILFHRRWDSPPDKQSSTSTSELNHKFIYSEFKLHSINEIKIFRCLSSLHSMSLIGEKKMNCGRRKCDVWPVKCERTLLRRRWAAQCNSICDMPTIC